METCLLNFQLYQQKYKYIYKYLFIDFHFHQNVNLLKLFVQFLKLQKRQPKFH